MAFIDYYQPVLDLMDLLIKERCSCYRPIDTAVFRSDLQWAYARSKEIEVWLKHETDSTTSQDATTQAMIQLRDQITWDRYYQDMTGE